MKYGKPEGRYVQRPEIDPSYLFYMLNDYYPTLDIRRTQAVSHYVEYWLYDDYAIGFRNWDGLDGWRLDTTYHPFIAIPNGLEMFEATPPRYEDPYRDRRFDVPYQVAQFRGENGKTRVELYYALTDAEVKASGTDRGVRNVSLKQGLFLFDGMWDTVAARVERVTRLPHVVPRAHAVGYLFSGERLELYPGTYNLAAEVMDLESDAIGAFREGLVVRDFGPGPLKLSDVLLARRVVEREDREGRDRFMVLPNPMQKVGRNEPAAFYFEVYNLSRNDYGRTHYRVSYQVQALQDEDADGPHEWSTAVSYDHEGSAAWEPQYLRLDMTDAQPGLRTFKVVVEDLASGDVAESVVELRVMW